MTLLQADFRPPDQEALIQEARDEDNALKGFLVRVRGVEGIDARRSSEENIELGQAVERLLEPAPVTASFKGFIAHEVQEARAWQSKVSDAVSPSRLGLLSGNGIFDPALAQGLEGQALRGYAFDIVRRYTIAPADVVASDLPPLLLMPGARPSDYVAAVKRLGDWTVDYQCTYDKSPFEGIEPDAYRDAAQQAHVISGEEAESGRWTALVERLDQLRDQSERE